MYWWKSHPDPSQRTLLFASEETGFRHLYLYLVQLSPPSSASTLEHPAHEDQGKERKTFCLNEENFIRNLKI